jgi:hypothetical protein
MPLSDADYTMLLRLDYHTCALKLELFFLKMELVAKAGFNPNQPRVPRGNPAGGQWTNGGGAGSASAGRFGGRFEPSQTQPISSRPRSGGTVRLGGRLVQATPAQQARFAISEARAQATLRRVREVDPDWRSTPSLHETVEGAISANERVVHEAGSRLAELGRPPALQYQQSRQIVQPGGRIIGIHRPRAGEEIRTVTNSITYWPVCRSTLSRSLRQRV